MKILLTGKPGSGKTRIIETLNILSPLKVTGFLTREIREDKKRTGFSIITLGEKSETNLFAHIKIKSPYRVGKYGVRPEALNPLIEELEEKISSGYYFQTLF